MYLIVGGSGFIGTSLCSYLSDNNKDFIILDKLNSNSFPEKTTICDIRDRDKLFGIKQDPDLLINLAAEHRDDVKPRRLYDEVNIGGAENLCEFSERKKINKIIFTSSVAVYGFAEPGTNENGKINPFNDYGRTKYAAELIYRKWQMKDPENRTLVIIRPTVVFGEKNRGNVYNLLKQIAKNRFLMIGNGSNKKSMAYVENVASFIDYCSSLDTGIHLYNYIDKPDYDMNHLVRLVRKKLGMKDRVGARIPYSLGLLGGYICDLVSFLIRKPLSISSIRVKKFCKTTVFEAGIEETGFIPPVNLSDALEQTINYEFIEDNEGEVFYTE